MNHLESFTKPCPERAKSIQSINTCLLELGVNISIAASESHNEHLVFISLPVGKQNVYWLTAVSKPTLQQLFEFKHRLDIIMLGEEGLLIESDRIIARNAKYVVVIEPKNIIFDRYLKKI